MTDPGTGGERTPDAAASPAAGVVTQQHGRVAVLRVTGALDLALAPELRRHIESAARDEPALLVIDLTAVTFLASAGMAELVRAHRGRTPVRVVAGSRITLRPLELTRLTDELVIRPTLAEAMTPG